MVIFTIIRLLLIGCIRAHYSYQPSNNLNPIWMSFFDNGIPIRQLSLIGSHSSMAFDKSNTFLQTQSGALMWQLKYGIRALDLHCRHYQNSFAIYNRNASLNTDLAAVLATVANFLQKYPSEAILIHIVQENQPSGNSRTFQQTFISYKNQYLKYIWSVTSQSPTLGEVRGKMVILQNFLGGSIYGLMYSTFKVSTHMRYDSIKDHFRKWDQVRLALRVYNFSGEATINFWTGHGDSITPYFVASGIVDPKQMYPLLFKSLNPDRSIPYYLGYPVTQSADGLYYAGINALAFGYILTQQIKYIGIVFTDFIGDAGISDTIFLNRMRFFSCDQSKIAQGCSYCDQQGSCLGCSQNHYVYNSLSLSCNAEKGYYLNWTNSTSNKPIKCEEVLKGCQECSSSTTCTRCNSLENYQLYNRTCQAASGYYTNSSTPLKCTLVGCYACASSSICSTCSATTNFVMDSSTHICICDSGRNFILSVSTSTCVCKSEYYLTSNGTCESLKPNNSSNSSSNSTVNSSLLCDAANNFQPANYNSSYCICKDSYYFTGSSCSLCSITLTNACLSCLSNAVCFSCRDNFTLFEGRCSCLPQYYLFNPGTCYLCEAGCLRCTNGSNSSICLACDVLNKFTLVSSACQCNPGLYLNKSQCLPCFAMPGCLTCNSLGCTSCNPIFGFNLNKATQSCECNRGHYSNSMNICEACGIGCLHCTIRNQCIQCNTTYFYLAGTTCKDICGDGHHYNLPCDDGNLIDGDGCSSTCQIQADYICIGENKTTPSICSFSGTINMQVISFMKDPSKNMVHIAYKIHPAFNQLNSIDLNKAFIPNFLLQSFRITYDKTSKILQMVLQYNQSLNSQQLSFQFLPPAIPTFFYVPRIKISLPYTTDNNLALKAYTQQQYDFKPMVELFCRLLAYLSLSIFLICFFFVSKLMAIQMILIFQIAFSALLHLQKMELYMGPLKNIWIFNGLSLYDQTLSLPGRVSQLHYKAQFLANFSVDFIIILLPISVGLALLLFGKIRRNKIIRITSFKVLKEWLISALLFVQINLNISICLAVVYSSNKTTVVVGVIIEILLLCQLILLIKRPKHFGQFTQSFESQFGKRWYSIVIIYRSLLSFMTGIFGANAMGLYISLSLATVFLFAQLIEKPYKFNLRPAVNTIFIVAILAALTISKIFQDSSSKQFYTSKAPLLIIGILYTALIFNLIFMILKFIKNCGKQQSKEIAKNEKEGNEEIGNEKAYFTEMNKNLKDSLLSNVLDLQRFYPETQYRERLHKLQLKNWFTNKMEDDNEVVDKSQQCRQSLEFKNVELSQDDAI